LWFAVRTWIGIPHAQLWVIDYGLRFKGHQDALKLLI